MNTKIPAFLAFSLSLFLAPAARAADPAQVLAQAKAATGGAAWDAVRSLHTRARVSTSGLTGPADSWEDTRTGRFVESFKLGPVSGADGFDGKAAWTQDPSGQTRVDDSGDAREGAFNEAYRRSLSYWYPDRRKGAIADAGDRTEGDRSFHAVRITPEGGRPFEVWIDASTHLIDRTVEKTAHETRTTYFSEYREVNGLRFPFASRSTNGETQYDQTATIESIEVNPAIDEAKFQRPEGKTQDFTIAGGKSSASLPFRLLNNHLYVQARINGKTLQMLFDTGGANILTPAAAERLGLKSEGALQMRGVGEKSETSGIVQAGELALGDVILRDQVFLTAPLSGLSDVEGVDVDGLVGFEVLKRFVTRVEYAEGRLIFFLPESFQPPTGATAVTFTFEGETPQVEGKIDGIPGRFTIDTGSRASLTINGPFAQEHGLQAKYGAKVEGLSGWGVGGGTRSLFTRARMLELGDVQVPGPLVDISLNRKGALANRYLAGNVGGGVLRRFEVTFDYGHQKLYFQPNASLSRPDPYDRTGMWLNRAAGGFQVMDAIPGGPAAEAGLKAGDTITAIDGKPAKDLLLPEVRSRFRTEAPGTELRFTVQSGGKEREVVVRLRDLV